MAEMGKLRLKEETWLVSKVLPYNKSAASGGI